jgi:hypothetical protein
MHKITLFKSRKLTFADLIGVKMDLFDFQMIFITVSLIPIVFA